MAQPQHYHHKLIRNKIPAIIAATGGQCEVRELEDTEYRTALKSKLFEECQELFNAPAEPQRVAELADILEVLDAFIQLHKISRRDVQLQKKCKRRLCGSFSKRLLLIRSTERESD